MKRIRKILALLLALALFLTYCTCAMAEGFTFNWDVDSNTAPHCKSILLMSLDTGAVVYSMNPDERLPVASLTKIMSYIVAYENIPEIETRQITIPDSVESELSGTDSSMAEFSGGEVLTGLQLLNLMMIPSGNNAALTLQKELDGMFERGELRMSDGWTPSVIEGSDEYYENLDPTDYSESSYFVHLMNLKAQELGCANTHFTNPHGLHNEAHYSTARDMAAITKYAMSLPSFTEITGTANYYYTPVSPADAEEREAHSTNRMFSNYADNSGNNYYYQYATGIKTGSLDEAGYCIVASATAYGYTYVAVCLGSPMYDEDGYDTYLHGEMIDAASLFRWALTHLEKRTVAVQGDVISATGLTSAWQKDTLQLIAGENVAVMLPSDVEAQSVLVTAEVPESVEAPVTAGDEIGTAIFTYAGEEVARCPLLASETVERSEVIRIWDASKDIFEAPWFSAILLVVGALVIVYIILILIYRGKQKKLGRVKRYRNI